MKYARFNIIAFVALSLVYLSFVVYRNANEKYQKSTDEPLSVLNQYETKTDTQGSVTIDVTPRISPEERQWKFEVVLDTHSVELDQDPLQIVTLIDDRMNIFKPIAWEGSGPGGHHREGILVFESVVPAPKYIEVKVKDIGNIPERLFKWNIQ